MKKHTIKYTAILLSILLAFSLAGCGTKTVENETLTKWDCSVICPEKFSPDVSYSDAEIVSRTGTLTFQNRNDFDIVVHVACGGKEEVEGMLPAGGSYSFACSTEKTYAIGAHANADAGTEIVLFVYDGKETEPYTK